MYLGIAAVLQLCTVFEKEEVGRRVARSGGMTISFFNRETVGVEFVIVEDRFSIVTPCRRVEYVYHSLR